MTEGCEDRKQRDRAGVRKNETEKRREERQKVKRRSGETQDVQQEGT